MSETHPKTRIFAAGGLIWCVALVVASALLVLQAPATIDRSETVIGLVLLPMPVVGALVAWRRPTNSVGWLLLAAGVVWTTSALADTYVTVSEPPADPLPYASWIGWIGTWAWFAAVSIIGAFMLFVFPTGHLPSPRWKPVVWAGVVALAVALVGGATDPTPVAEGLPNPLGSDHPIFELARTAAMSLAALFVAAAVSLVMRFRRSTGVERQQLKWFVYAAAVLPLAFTIAGLFEEGLIGAVAWVTLLLVAILGLPIVIGIAIMRYRLYDIDLVINRTLVYVALTALLAVVYLALVATISTFAGDSELVTAASTLAVATLFNPLRRRVQEQVDHVFYRRKYDARRTVDAFSSRLRDEIDLQTVNAELIDTVQRTMHPAHVSVWLKKGAEA